jgi:hypothetical protein
LLLYGLAKRNWVLVKRILKYVINSSVLLLGWSFYLELALIVRSPIVITNEASIDSLKEWIWNHQFKDILISLTTIGILLGINLFFYFKVEKSNNKYDPILLIMISTIFLSYCIWVTGKDTFSAFTQIRNSYLK